MHCVCYDLMRKGFGFEAVSSFVDGWDSARRWCLCNPLLASWPRSEYRHEISCVAALQMPSLSGLAIVFAVKSRPAL